MEDYKKLGYRDLIERLLACNGIGALITSIQNGKDKFDEDFFVVLEDEMKDAKARGNDKKEKSLAYLYRVMENLKIAPPLSSFADAGSNETGGFLGAIKKIFFIQ
ncbi:MAG: hypothetical protein ABRQ37_13110 [Candidatus Eremiobacterota bacterium]